MRTYSSIGLALLMVLGSTFGISADTPVVDRFTFARPPAPESTVDPKGRLSVNIERWTNNSTFSSNADFNRIGVWHQPYWMKLRNDGTTVYFYWSISGNDEDFNQYG